MAENEKGKKAGAEGTAEKPRPRRLLRSSSDRMLWGVAGGLGEYLRIDPTWVRLGFVAAAIFGGFGVIAYLVMAVVVPEDDGTGQPREGRRPPTWAIVLLALAVLVALPGPLWGWGWGWGDHDGFDWWNLFGPLWLLFLIAAGVLVVRAIRGGRPFRSRRETTQASAADATTAEAATAETEARGDEPPRAVRAIALVVLALAAICAAASVAACAAWATATGNGEVVAGLVIAIGVAIAATAFLADARRVAPWLLAAALILGLPAGATAAADIHFDGGIGEREYRPAALTDLPSDGYDFGVGQMTVDLRDLPWTEGQTVPLSTELGIGQLIVSVPPDVCVDADAKGKAGELLVRGEVSDGVDLEIDQSQPQGRAPRLDLSADIQIGQLIVTDQDPSSVEDHDLRESERDDELQRERAACAR
jgi:phage shock protein PspC (stress-responsive transcriptional regulator)